MDIKLILIKVDSDSDLIIIHWSEKGTFQFETENNCQIGDVSD